MNIPDDPDSNPWSIAAVEFLRHGSRFSKNTRETYGRVLRRFESFARGRGVADPARIDLQLLDRYAIDLAQRNLSAGSRRLELGALRSFLKWLRAHCNAGTLPEDWQIKTVLPLPKLSPSPVSSTSRLDQGTILADLQQRSESLGKRNRAIFMLSALVGLRASEIGALRGDHLIRSLADNGWCARIPGHGSRFRDVPLVDTAFRSLEHYLSDTARVPGRFQGYVFLAEDAAAESRDNHGLSRWTIAKVIKNAGKTLGLEVTPRSLRHAFGVGFLQQGGDIGRLQHLLGHESMLSTAAYARTAELADARETLERHVAHLEQLGKID